MNGPLKLDYNDARVVAARDAEKALFDFYGIKATDHYVSLPGPGIKVRISEFGTGKPLVLVPGNTGDVFPLASLLGQLKGRRIIAINRPGGGLSEGFDHRTVNIRNFAVQTLDTVMDHFGLTNADVVAHSMGAHWSLWLAMDKPERVRTLCLLGNPGNVMGGKPPLMMRLLAKPPFTSLLKLLIPSDKDKALNSLKAMGHSEETLAQLPKQLGDCYYYFRMLPYYWISFTSLMQNVAPVIDALQLHSVRQPTALLLGTKDTFASLETGNAIVAALQYGTLYPLPKAGHLPWLESPEECGKLILDFEAKNG